MRDPERPDRATITVCVFSPTSPDPKEFTWPRSLRVGEAAAQAAAEFGHAPGNPTFRNADGDILDRDRPLVAAGVRDGDKLELVDVGGGV